MCPVDIVIGNAEEASKTMEMMNKILRHICTTLHMRVWKFDEEFVKLLLRKTVDPTLVADIENCTWDQDAKTMRTPKDKEAEDQRTLKRRSDTTITMRHSY